MTAPGAVVLVVGPPLAGVSGVVGALRLHLGECAVVESAELGTPAAVVAVVSAVAPLTASDWDLICHAAAPTGPVLAAVAKIDAHLRWRDVLARDRDLVAGWTPGLPAMPWVGVAAAPDLGEPDVGALVALLRSHLAAPCLPSRIPLRSNASRGGRRRPDRVARPSPGTVAVETRAELQRVRLRLLRVVRDRCASMRVEFRDAATAMATGGTGRFEALVRAEAGRFVADLDDEITLAVGNAASELGVAPPRSPVVPAPPVLARAPSASRRLEARLTAVLGVGFGLGVALASSRLLAGLAPGLSAAALALGGAVGLALATWVVRVRALLHDRALLERWSAEVTATLRWHGEAVVAERLLGAETAWSRANPSPNRSESSI